MLKTIKANGLQYRMGRNRPTTPHFRSSFRKMIDASVLPKINFPKRSRYGLQAYNSVHNIYGNDTLGDCVIAGGFHVRGITSGNAGKLKVFTQDQVIHDYSAIGGYDPDQTQPDGYNPTDQGCDENTAINYWEHAGFPDGVRLVSSITVDPTDVKEMQLAVYLFENLYLGIELPDAWVSPFPSDNGFKWDYAGQPDPQNGHCVMIYDYCSVGLQVATWGMWGQMTWKALAEYCSANNGGQMFCLLSPDIVNRLTLKSPVGYDIKTLIKYLKGM